MLASINLLFAMEGVGLVLLGKILRVRRLLAQGFFQFLIGIAGLVVGIFAKDQPLMHAIANLCWLTVIPARYWIYREVSRGKIDVSGTKPTTLLFSVEMYVYLFLSVGIFYFHVVEACNLPLWTTLCWSFVFASSIVSTRTLGGIGIDMIGLGKASIFITRLAVLVGLGTCIYMVCMEHLL